jgi:hypothetical protein
MTRPSLKQDYGLEGRCDPFFTASAISVAESEPIVVPPLDGNSW